MRLRIFAYLFASLLFPASVFAQEDPARLLREGVRAADQGRFDRALELFRRADGLDPGKSIYKYEIALVHFMKKEYDQHDSHGVHEDLDGATKRPSEPAFEMAQTSDGPGIFHGVQLLASGLRRHPRIQAVAGRQPRQIQRISAMVPRAHRMASGKDALLE